MKMKMLATGVLLSMAAYAQAQTPLVYVHLEEPCRLLDTRLPVGDSPAQPLAAGQVLNVGVGALAPCSVPPEAAAIQANVTVTNTQGPGFMAIVKGTAPVAKTSVLNFVPGQTVANSAIIGLNAALGFKSFSLMVGVSGTDLVLDISGYYVALP